MRLYDVHGLDREESRSSRFRLTQPTRWPMDVSGASGGRKNIPLLHLLTCPYPGRVEPAVPAELASLGPSAAIASAAHCAACSGCTHLLSPVPKENKK